jgi:hypothetical protein
MPGMMLKLNDKEVPNLNRAVVFARNVGNDVIDNFVVSLSIDGPHDFFVGDIRASEQLKNYATQSHCHGENRDAVTVSLPFLNPKEHFTITLFFDGETNPCKVEFRMAGVKSKTKASPVTAFGPELLVALSRNVLFKAILKLF